MARLPQSGGEDTWGNVLNGFLSRSHNTDGTLKTDSVGSAQLKPSVVASANLADGAVTNTKLDAATQASLAKADTALQTAPVGSVVGQTGVITGAQIAADPQLSATYAQRANVQVFTTPGAATWTKPAGGVWVEVERVSGGGGARSAPGMAVNGQIALPAGGHPSW